MTGGREIRHGHEVPAQRLGQALDERGDLVLQEARHQPLESLRCKLIEQGQRHQHAHAVFRVAGLEVILQRETGAVDVAPIRKLRGRHLARRAAHEIVLCEKQAVWLLLLDHPAPVLEAATVAHIRGDTLVVKGDNTSGSTRMSWRRTLCSRSCTSPISARLCEKNGARVSYSPSTRAWRMNSTRASTGSMRPYCTLRCMTTGRPYRVTRSFAITAATFFSQRGSE